MSFKDNRLLSLLPLILVLFLWNVPLFLRGFYVQGEVIWELVFLEAFLLAAFVSVAVLRKRLARFYLITAYFSVAFAIIFILTGLFRYSLFYILSVLVSVRLFSSLKGKNDFSIASMAAAVLFLLLILSTSIRFTALGGSGIAEHGYVFSIYNNASPGGIPFTYAYGLVFSVRAVTLTLSPLTAVLFPLTAYLTADNTVLILVGYGSQGTSSFTGAAVTALACQCENTIGILSGTVSSLALSILPYFIFLSAGMLLLTNVYLHHPRRMGFPNLSMWIIVAVFLAILAVEFAIVSSGAIYNLSIFGFASFLSIMSGFLLGFAVPTKRRLPSYSIAFAFIIQGVMFWPLFIREALSLPLVFEAYNFAGLSAGLLLSLSLKNRQRIAKVGLIELIFSMETMITAVFLYLTLFSVSIFSGFSENAVINFSVFILALSLPIMWFSNIYLLSARAFQG